MENKTRILGLDIGDKYIGVAMSDPGRVLASPLTILKRGDDTAAIESIAGIIDEHGVSRVIVGLPLSLDGQPRHQAKKVETFTQQLAENTEITLEYRDERYSTVTARQMLAAGGKKGGRKITRDDAAAAAIILQGYLDESRP
ncbi:MAG: Holliday junction resolvase RuvX [Dehalococcoidales bacterium]